MTQTITPDRLATALDGHRGVRVLSLDCFDTLLWRDVHRPADIFPLLGTISREQRMRAESGARKARHLEMGGGSTEVTLREIYTAHMPHAEAAAIDALVDVEIAVEARHCYAFAPTVELMHEAKRRGIKIVIVSDTYLERDQLEALLRSAAGDEVVDMIDRIFTSCDHRSAKGDGLFDAVVAAMGIPAQRILHIGDNQNADLHAAIGHGLRALHLVQFEDSTVQRLRQESAIGALLTGEGAAFQPHRATLALGEPKISDPAERLGYSVIGPAMTAFAGWIRDEAQALQDARGGTIHQLFLMRDGHLPALVAEACDPTVTVHRVELSRFASTAASFAMPGEIHRHAVDEIEDKSGTIFLKQLLLTDEEAETLLAARPVGVGGQWLFDRIVAEPWLTTIRERGAEYADRLFAYLATFIDPKPGDTIMLVDLGYNGSVQNRIDGLFAERLGVHVAGRYLMLRETVGSGLDKKGMIDGTRFDDGTITAMIGSVSILEQFCSVPQGSVVDYAAGEPIRSDAGLKGAQSAMRDRVQAGAVRFAREMSAAMIRPVDRAAKITWVAAACAALGRFLTLPRPAEVALFREFEHDVNLGTTQTVALFDPEEAARNLRRSGLSYIKDTRRMFLPAELSSQGLPVALTHLVLKRFALNLNVGDFCDGSIDLPVMIADGQQSFTDVVRATPTHDGYYVAAVPIGDRRYTVGLQFGRLYEWLQIDSADFLPVDAFLQGETIAEQRSIPAEPSCEAIEQVAPHLFRCDPAGFLMVPPPAETPLTRGRPMMLAIVFRPTVARESVAAKPAPTPEITPETTPENTQGALQ